MSQGSFWDTTMPTGPQTRAGALPPHNGTPASIDGAKAARARKNHEERTVLACIRNAGAEGATNQEIVERTGIKESAICGRTNELRALFHIEVMKPRRPSVFKDGTRSKVAHQCWRIKGATR